jgi:hypothetical protein
MERIGQLGRRKEFRLHGEVERCRAVYDQLPVFHWVDKKRALIERPYSSGCLSILVHALARFLSEAAGLHVLHQ